MSDPRSRIVQLLQARAALDAEIATLALRQVDIAAQCGVRMPVVSNWIKRHPDFPAPVSDDPRLYLRSEVMLWYAAHQGRMRERHERQAARLALAVQANQRARRP